MAVNRGDVWWYDDPDNKRRPYVVLSRDQVIPHLTRLVAAPITSVIRNLPSEVVLGIDDGMPTECVVSLDNVSVIYRSLLTERITQLNGLKLTQICDALAFAIDC